MAEGGKAGGDSAVRGHGGAGECPELVLTRLHGFLQDVFAALERDIPPPWGDKLHAPDR